MENNLYRQINIEWIVKFFVDVDRLRAHEAAGESYIECVARLVRFRIYQQNEDLAGLPSY